MNNPPINITMPFTTRVARRALLASCLLVLGAGTMRAQSMDAQAGAGVLLESYSFTDGDQVNIDKVSLLSVPMSARVPLARSLELGVNTAYASGSRTRPGGQSTTISGLTDTEIRLTYRLADDRIRLTAAALAPTGKSKLTADQMEVSGLIASDLLPFAVSNWGSGGGVGLSAALALPVSEETSLGLSAGYMVGRTYEPLSAQTYAYHPGNQLQVRAAMDRSIGVAAKASLQLTYLHFNQDQTAGTNFYQTGDRLQALGSVAFAAGDQGTGVVYAGYLQRKLGQYTNVVDFTPAQDLVYAGGGFRHPLGRMILVPSLDLRLLGSDEGVGQGRTFSIGLGAEIPMGGVDLMPLVRGRTGLLTIRSGQESTFKGFELGLSIRHQAISR